MSINLAADLPCEKSAGAPADEIEITPEMIETGAECLWKHPIEMYPSEEEMKVIVFDLFKTMAEARPR
jgi:hypothetical protein